MTTVYRVLTATIAQNILILTICWLDHRPVLHPFTLGSLAFGWLVFIAVYSVLKPSGKNDTQR